MKSCMASAEVLIHVRRIADRRPSRSMSARDLNANLGELMAVDRGSRVNPRTPLASSWSISSSAAFSKTPGIHVGRSRHYERAGHMRRADLP